MVFARLLAGLAMSSPTDEHNMKPSDVASTSSSGHSFVLVDHPNNDYSEDLLAGIYVSSRQSDDDVEEASTPQVLQGKESLFLSCQRLLWNLRPILRDATDKNLSRNWLGAHYR